MSQYRNRVLWVLLLVLGCCCLFQLMTSVRNRSHEFVNNRDTYKELLPNVINPNTASWASMARLPGVGVTLAKSIVSYREEYSNRNGQDRQPFHSGDDLAKVKRIGPVTVRQIEKYLTFEQLDGN